MSNISLYGYESIQNYIASNFAYIELQDNTGIKVKRFTTTDGLLITNDTVNKTITYQIVVTGDSTFLNKTVSKSIIFGTSTSNEPFAIETFTPFTFESADDQLTVKHIITVPTV